MPIDRDRFDSVRAEALDLKEGTNAYEVFQFLAASPDSAFTRAEIRDGTGVADGSVGPVLSRLDEEDLIEHRGQYWAVADDVLDK